jgi:transcriptional regulator with XRE-family HTH domain
VRTWAESGSVLSTDLELSDDEGALITGRIREELARRRISRQRLADDARISISTLEKALAGRRPYTLATTIRLEEALGVRLRGGVSGAPVEAAPSGHAPESLGAYSRQAVTWLEGEYLTLRPSFGQADAVYAYRTHLTWNDEACCLVFRESDRLDAAYVQRGTVSLPNKSGQVYLITNDEGQIRLLVLGRPVISGEMYGLLTTLHSAGSHLTPTACPIVLTPLRNIPDARFGLIAPGDAQHSDYRRLLDRATGDAFVKLYGA